MLLLKVNPFGQRPTANMYFCFSPGILVWGMHMPLPRYVVMLRSRSSMFSSVFFFCASESTRAGIVSISSCKADSSESLFMSIILLFDRNLLSLIF